MAKIYLKKVKELHDGCCRSEDGDECYFFVVGPRGDDQCGMGECIKEHIIFKFIKREDQMNQTTTKEQINILNFTENAKKYFNENAQCETYGDIRCGELFAMRWGLLDDCILVFRIDENFEPIIFKQELNERIK